MLDAWLWILVGCVWLAVWAPDMNRAVGNWFDRRTAKKELDNDFDKWREELQK